MQILDAGAGVAPERDIGFCGAAELLGDDVEVDERLALGRHGVALGRDLAELAADDEEAVRFLDQRVGDAVVAAEQPGAERIGAGDRALAGHGVRDRNLAGAREIREHVGGAADVDAAAGEHERAAGLRKERRGALGRSAVRPAAQRGRGLVGRIGGEILVLERQRRVADVLRHVDDDGPRPARGRDREGAAHELGDALDALDADQLLAGRPEDLGLARFLGHVLPGVQAVRIADEHHHRRAGVERLDEPGDEVRGAGAERRVGKADPARHLGVGVGREDAGALVVDEVVREPQPAGGVIERQELEPAHPEHRPALVGRDHPGQRLAAGHLVGGHLTAFMDGTLATSSTRRRQPYGAKRTLRISSETRHGWRREMCSGLLQEEG